MMTWQALNNQKKVLADALTKLLRIGAKNLIQEAVEAKLPEWLTQLRHVSSQHSVISMR